MEPSYEKKSFNIHSQHTSLMKSLIPSRKQTEFVNRAIQHELEREIEKRQRAQALEKMREFKKIRQSLPKSARSSEETLSEMRKERLEPLDLPLQL